MSTTTPLTNPFVGLRAFEESEDYLFFGRSKQINELLKKLKGSRFLAVIGSSGSGKSSLVKSGLMPAIYSGFMTAGSNWRVALFRPGDNPISNLTKALATKGVLNDKIDNTVVPLTSIIESSLRRSERGLIQVYNEANLAKPDNLLVVIDQFEELFRFKNEKEIVKAKSDAQHFIQLLLAASQYKEEEENPGRIYIMLTMRSDFLGDCSQFRGLPEAINEGQYLVPRMTREEIREAITGPVAVSTATITPRLVTRLLNDVDNNTDQLPVLQHAMMRTWDYWHTHKSQNTPIDFDDYEQIGCMKLALSQHAEEAYAELKKEKQPKYCELIFKALTDKSADVRGIRRPKSLADLCILANASQAEVIEIVNVFRRTGRTFLMPPPDVELNSDSIIDISHESLMRVWDRLVKWTVEEARSGDVYLRLVNAAERAAEIKKENKGVNKDDNFLPKAELGITLTWFEKEHPTAKWAEGYKGNFKEAIDYLEASKQNDLAEKKRIADRERLRRRLTNAIFALLGLVLIGGGWSYLKINDALKKAVEAKADADRAEEIAYQQKMKAVSKTYIAIHMQSVADTSAIAAKTSGIAAQIAQLYAEAATKDAEEKTKIAKDAMEATTVALNKVKVQNIRIAANEYVRLIREEVPKEINKSNPDKICNPLLAYCYHFDVLDTLTKNPNDKIRYNQLREKLYYNNDLYEKLYYSFASLDTESVVLENYKSSYDFETITFLKTNRVGLRDNNKEIKLTYKGGTTSVKEPGKKYVALAAGKKSSYLISSTEDNLILVYQFDGTKLNLQSTINMGAKVTALSYNDSLNVIYFGTQNGDIGYITYNVDKKNQPVFANTLTSNITAIEYFKSVSKIDKKERSYLLVTGYKSKPVVYKLDDESIFPNKELLGNSLPKKNFYEINHATFIDSLNCVLISTASKGKFLWNPFADDLLDKLKQNQNLWAADAKFHNWSKTLINSNTKFNDLRLQSDYYTEVKK